MTIKFVDKQILLIRQLCGYKLHVFSFQISVLIFNRYFGAEPAARSAAIVRGFRTAAPSITASPQFSGDCIGRVTPVPISNTEVKPTGADDTAAFSCGKVGSRRI